MHLEPQHVSGCYLVSPDPVEDDRGFFARVFSADEFEAEGLVPQVAQINVALSVSAGTIRGIHWQEAPHAEAKLVRCIKGSVFEVCVDLRPGSETWGEWVGVELTSDNRHALYIPPGCGNAYQSLEDGAEVLYSTSTFYTPDAERGARWNDTAFSIDWPITKDVIVSDKDRAWPDVDSS